MVGVEVGSTFIEIKARNTEEYKNTVKKIENACGLTDIEAVEFGYSYGKLSSVIVISGDWVIERFPATSVADNDLIV